MSPLFLSLFSTLHVSSYLLPANACYLCSLVVFLFCYRFFSVSFTFRRNFAVCLSRSTLLFIQVRFFFTYSCVPIQLLGVACCWLFGFWVLVWVFGFFRGFSFWLQHEKNVHQPLRRNAHLLYSCPAGSAAAAAFYFFIQVNSLLCYLLSWQFLIFLVVSFPKKIIGLVLKNNISLCLSVSRRFPTSTSSSRFLLRRLFQPGPPKGTRCCVRCVLLRAFMRSVIVVYFLGYEVLKLR